MEFIKEKNTELNDLYVKELERSTRLGEKLEQKTSALHKVMQEMDLLRKQFSESRQRTEEAEQHFAELQQTVNETKDDSMAEIASLRNRIKEEEEKAKLLGAMGDFASS